MRKSACRTHPFTLVEIIAVLIILGILVAVAVPKYFSLVEASKTRSLQGALAEGMSICSLCYSQAVLEAGGNPQLSAVDALADAEGLAVKGDFVLTFAPQGSTGILCTATGAGGIIETSVSGTRLWTIPSPPAAETP
jgi:MSHA pilin protein MshA